MPGLDQAILRCSRRLGWAFGAGLVLTAVLLVLAARDRIEHTNRVAEATAQAFVDKVIACRRAGPRPHPSWADCERRVRNAE